MRIPQKGRGWGVLSLQLLNPRPHTIYKCLYDAFMMPILTYKAYQLSPFKLTDKLIETSFKPINRHFNDNY